MEPFIHGIILAFGLILPLGVQNLFVFTQGALQSSLWQVMPAVVTAGLCDTLLIMAAVLGVSLVILSFAWMKMTLLGVGFVFLAYMGWVSWQSKLDSTQAVGGSGMPPAKQIMFAASVSLLNPHAILDTIGVIGTSSLNYTGSSKVVFTTACIVVSWLWFFALAFAGRTIGSLDASGRVLGLMGKISAVFIWGAAVYLGYGMVGGL
ncbi:LysE/ArgO family amino acid transporter [Sporomusa malonica]|uniref:L-lysine exporter family protein LysE/ArgO n=1 Tax=Sporomusa malonica TaxID=112901 RepID=A0A1W1YPS1_9FIRM|nr:LysE/ArgO family amino acid transporter [Sporomusa malonica]SMC38126.1 L-lysine exporter family protein LysE/ArgO [Sporomusa malonica]